MDAVKRCSNPQIRLNRQAFTPPPGDLEDCSVVTKLLELLRKRKRGESSFLKAWNVFTFSLSHFEELQRQLKADRELWRYVEDKVRYDYSSLSQRLVVRMPTSMHEALIGRVKLDILTQLEAIARHEDSAGLFAKQITLTESTRLIWESPGQAIRHDPDASFKHRDAPYPGVIIEVSHSQKRRDLPKLADDYILESDGSIRLVVGLDLEYCKTNNAAIVLWRPKSVTCGDGSEELIAEQVHQEVFCYEAGIPVPSASLEIPLKDFAPSYLNPHSDINVSLPSEKLCAFIKDPMGKHGNEKAMISLGIRKRKRGATTSDK